VTKKEERIAVKPISLPTSMPGGLISSHNHSKAVYHANKFARFLRIHSAKLKVTQRKLNDILFVYRCTQIRISLVTYRLYNINISYSKLHDLEILVARQ